MKEMNEIDTKLPVCNCSLTFYENDRIFIQVDVSFPQMIKIK